MSGANILKISTAVVALMAGQSAFAQTEPSDAGATTLDTIIVTATKREVSILDVPQSIQAIGGEELEDLAINNVEDVAALVPNLNIEVDRKYGGQFNIRGFGDQGRAFASFSTVGIYVDETPLTDGFANLDSALYDLERVEVLRGPQGTLYGEGSLAGTVRLITNKPDLNEYSAELLARGEMTKDGDPSYRVGGYFNIPISEDIAALRITGSYDDQGGFMDAGPFPTGAPITEDINERKSSYVRAALKVEPSQAFSFTPSFVYQKNKAAAGPIDSLALPDLVGYSNGPDSFQDDLYIYALEAEYDFGPVTLTSSSSYYDRAFDSIDDDLQANTIISLFIGPSDFTTQTFTRDTETFTQELRLTSNGEGPFSWLVGGFYRDKDLKEDVLIVSPTIENIVGDGRTFLLDNTATFEQFAVFGEASYQLTDKFSVTGGLRWFDETAESSLNFGVFDLGVFGFVQNPNITPTLSESDVLFKAAATYEASDDLTFYALYSEGYRPGGVNDRVVDIGGMLTPTELTALSTYGQDETKNYEIGLKSVLFGGRANVNLTLFYIDWTGTQVSAEPLPGVNVVVNASGADSIGIEFDAIAQVTDKLQIGGTFGYASAEISSETASAAGIIPEGAVLPQAPEFSGSIFAEYVHPVSENIEARFRIDGRYTDDRVNRVDVVGLPGTPLDSYSTVNALVGLEADDWSLNVYANNLTNELAELDGVLFDDGTVGNIVAGYVRNRPRTIGIQVKKRF